VIVIDASVLAKFVLKEKGWSEVVQHLRAGAISVDQIAKEVASAVLKRRMAGDASGDEARIMLRVLKGLLGVALKMEGELAYLEEAIEISLRRNANIYDSLYVALAKRLGLKLLTADERQASIATSEGVVAVLMR
jgi:predicted nucleic acid-binding protein